MELEQVPTEALRCRFCRGQPQCRKTRPDGTILEGYHRIYVLQQRGVDVSTVIPSHWDRSSLV